MIFILSALLFNSLVFARDLYGEYEFAKFSVGGKTVTAFIADNDEKRALGLMDIERLDQDEGMLFVFERKQKLSFWMKNTVIPLSIGFFDENGEFIHAREMTVPSVMESNPPSYQSRGPALYALEMNTGWFTKNKIEKGTKLAPQGTVKSLLLNKYFLQTKKHGQ
jgi:uncharacterized membrane protein (UPF0127 family)